jgi:hypothetical protein
VSDDRQQNVYCLAADYDFTLIVLGYLIGPMIGTKLWSIVHRKHAKDIEEKDRRFYEHILRKRCDPSRQTMQNRVVDFYVGSLQR